MLSNKTCHLVSCYWDKFHKGQETDFISTKTILLPFGKGLVLKVI